MKERKAKTYTADEYGRLLYGAPEVSNKNPRNFMAQYQDDPAYKRAMGLGLVGLASEKLGLDSAYGMVKDKMLDRKDMNLSDAFKANRQLGLIEEFANQRQIDANLKEDMRDKTQESLVKQAKIARRKIRPRSLLAKVQSDVDNTLGSRQTLG